MMQSSLMFVTPDGKYFIGPNFKIPTKYIKFWYQESSPLALIQNRSVFVLSEYKALKNLVDSDGCFYVNGTISPQLQKDLVNANKCGKQEIEITQNSFQRADSTQTGEITEFKKITMTCALGITALVFILGIIFDSRSRSRYY